MSKNFITKIKVNESEIDKLFRENNVIYVRRIQDVAGLHWARLTQENLQTDYIWVVIRHEKDCVHSAVLHDEITIKTWVGETQGVRSIRYVEIYKDNTILVKAQTIWCLLDAKTLCPKRINESVLKILLP